jgi:putative peptide zinc metalloprotease protein
MNITFNSRITMVPIRIRKDQKHYIVEDKLTGEFYEMPEVCIEAINLMNQGAILVDIERDLKEKFKNVEVDILDFAEQLLELKLIESIDDIKVVKQQNPKEQLGFFWISPRVGKFFFNRFTLPLYIAIFILNIVILIMNPSLFPHHQDIFVFDIMVVNVIFWMAFSFLLVLIHEVGHVLPMRAKNLPTKLEVSHRMFFVVLQTDMSSVWKLAPKDRSELYLGGLCFDSVLLFISLIFQLIIPVDHWFIQGLMQLAVFDIVLRMLFQCCIYMKTDLYFVFENISGCYNLMENTKQTIRQRFSFLKSKVSEEVIFSGEKKTVFIYSLFYLLGIILTVVLYFMYYIPEVIYAAKKLLPGFAQPPSSLLFWDALVFSLQVGIFITLLLYSWRKKYILNKM